ncbi:MAG: aspartate carbamoyltransferase catalytic subunit [bacterium]
MNWTGKDILGLAAMEREEIEAILGAATAMKERLWRGEKKTADLKGKVIVTLFYEPSTRTRTSFELAGKYLGVDVVNIAVAAASVQKGETLKDTARTLAAMGVDAVVLRHPHSGSAAFLAEMLAIPVINAGDGMHEHPTQGLLDLFTIREQKGRLAGLRAAIIGDIRHSRVARSDIWGLTRMGATVAIAGPATLLPPEIAGPGVTCHTDVDAALTGADVIIALRLQLERQAKGLIPSLAEYNEMYCIDARRLDRAKPDALLLHPGPINRGVEISPAAADGPQSAILAQVTNGVAVRMALLNLLLGGGE